MVSNISRPSSLGSPDPRFFSPFWERLIREPLLPSPSQTPVLRHDEFVRITPSIFEDKELAETDRIHERDRVPLAKRLRLEESHGQRGGVFSSGMKIDDPMNKDAVADIYSRLFGPNLQEVHFKQRSIGNCYFLAALRTMLDNSERSRILRKIKIQEVPAKGRDPLRYRVTFPGRRAIEVNARQIGQDRDGRQPVYGPLGVQLLELAYGKMIRKERNDAREKENDPKKAPYPHRGRNRTPSLMERGSSQHALMQMLGGGHIELTADQSKPFGLKVESTRALDQNPEIVEQLEIFLRGVAPHPDAPFVYLLTAIMPDNLPKDVADDGVIHLQKSANPVSSQRQFYRNHVYSVQAMDLGKRTITVVNPHDTKKAVHTMSFEEFCEVFWKIEGIYLDKSTL